jgi:hypothetical protein
MALLVLVLVGVGVLLGSFLIEWRGTELVVPDGDRVFDGTPSTVAADPHGRRVSVEVLNGAGDPGAASRVTRVLRDAGYDVKTYGNAPSYDYDDTLVIDRSGVAGAARSVADALGVTEIVSEPRPDLFVDATIILGRDWKIRLEGIR